jgi:hypothetical protein
MVGQRGSVPLLESYSETYVCTGTLDKHVPWASVVVVRYPSYVVQSCLREMVIYHLTVDQIHTQALHMPSTLVSSEPAPSCSSVPCESRGSEQWWSLIPPVPEGVFKPRHMVIHRTAIVLLSSTTDRSKSTLDPPEGAYRKTKELPCNCISSHLAIYQVRPPCTLNKTPKQRLQ